MRFLLPILVFSISTLLAQQTVPEVQTPIVTKVTATWCSPCGGWGWDLFEELIEDNESSAVLIAGHYRGSDLETVAGSELAANFNATGQPSFFLGNERQSASSGTSAAARTTIKNTIDVTAATVPIVNTAIYWSDVQDRAYTFETTTQFFQAATGEYNLAVYAVEDDVVNRQTSRGNDAIHKRVLRGNIDGQTTFGSLVVNGTAAVDDTFSSSFTFDFPTTWNIDNIRLVTVLWKKNGATWDFVNANEVVPGEWVNVSNTDNLLAAEDYRITGFSESGILTTTLDLAKESRSAILELIDVNGRLLATRQLGNTPSGKTQITWDGTSLATGIYAVRLAIGTRSISETVIVQ